MPLLDLFLVKDQLKITTTDNDVDLQSFMDATETVVEDHLNKIITPRTFTQDFTFYGPVNRIRVNHRPLTALTSISNIWTGNSFDVSNAIVRDYGLIMLRTPVQGDVQVEYTAGTADADIPENWKLAATFIVQSLWETRRGTMGTPVNPILADSMANDSYREGYLVGYTIPSKALELLGPRWVALG